jgi:hypothetical protein
MPADNDGNNIVENDKCFQEWKECNEKIAKFDNILIDLRKYGFTVASSLMTAGSFLGLQTYTQFQPFQIVIIFATMALVTVLYWLDIYYQTILAAIILRTQVLEKKLSFGIDIYVSRFYMRHRIGKALHLLYVGFLVSLVIIGAYVVHNNKLDYESGISLPLWILLLCVPIIFVFCLYFFFDRRRYRTYSEAQPIISNFLRSTGKNPEGKTIDQEIMEFLDSDKEDLGLDLETNEWVYLDYTGICLRRYLGWSNRLIVTNKRLYGIDTNLLMRTLKVFEYYSFQFQTEDLAYEKFVFSVIPLGLLAHQVTRTDYSFNIKVSQKDCSEIVKRLQQVLNGKDPYYIMDSSWW